MSKTQSMKRRLVLSGFMILSFLLTSACAGLSRGDRQPPRLAAQPAPVGITGFAQAEEVRNFFFPADHGAHPEYQTEWWYYTGNLSTADGRRFGYQLTFFRRALLPANLIPERQSEWATAQVYMAHFALTDVGGDKFQAFERLARGGAGLGGAQAEPFRVWLEDWNVTETPADADDCQNPDSIPCVVHLQAEREDVSIDLTLEDMLGPVLQGDQGLSRKGAAPGQASYYYSLTRLKTQGIITMADERFDVDGWSWMDHEWSTSALSEDQVGWDWFSIQLEGGGELMLFQIRRADGSIDPYSSGLLISKDGESELLSVDDFSITVEDTWTSPHTGATYPARWRLVVPALDLSLNLKPHLADQELNVSYAYWEGAVAVQGEINGVVVSGNGYVELTGYSGSMGGEF